MEINHTRSKTTGLDSVGFGKFKSSVRLDEMGKKAKPDRAREVLLIVTGE
jgi:hypothetical protein